MIYLDNAATAHPRPAAVADAVVDYLRDVGANPGRAGHGPSIAAARLVFDARRRCAALLGASDPRRVVFTSGATEALNMALLGMVRPGDHVVATSMEHNSVLRPLRRLREEHGVRVTVVSADAQGLLAPADFATAVRPDTRLVVVNHASNVVGAIAPLGEIRAAIGGVPLLVDAAQSAGHVPIDVERDGVSLLAFTGHKALMGPPGTGGLYIAPDVTLAPVLLGGTGSNSESDAPPDALPDRFEPGTRNTAGLAGLAAALRWRESPEGAALLAQEGGLFARLWSGLAAIPGVTCYGPDDLERRTPTLSFTVAGRPASDIGRLLDRRHGVAARVGLHCAPEAHRTLGTFPGGTVRMATGPFTTAEHIERTLAAVREFVQEGTP